MIKLLTSRDSNSCKKSRPAIVCGSSLARGVATGTLTLPKGRVVRWPYPGMAVLSSALRAELGIGALGVCKRMRKS